MLSVIIIAGEAERRLVQTLAALVSGAASGLVKEAMIVDALGSESVARVADVAGCDLLTPDDLPDTKGKSEMIGGALLAAAAAKARAPWLLFLRQGTVPDAAWISAVQQFTEEVERDEPGAALAGTFRLMQRTRRYGRDGGIDMTSLVETARRKLGGLPRPDGGLLIAKRFYDSLGGHGARATAERDLLRRIGRRRLVTLHGSALTLAAS